MFLFTDWLCVSHYFSFGFITFDDLPTAKKALDLDGQEIDGFNIGLRFAEDKPRDSGGRGGGRGGGGGYGGGGYDGGRGRGRGGGRGEKFNIILVLCVIDSNVKYHSVWLHVYLLSCDLYRTRWWAWSRCSPLKVGGNTAVPGYKGLVWRLLTGQWYFCNCTRARCIYCCTRMFNIIVI